jgi:UDP-N-acetylglucosamine acyltransferase
MDVAPFAIAQGDRAVLRGLNLVGMKRLGMDRASIGLIKEAYKTVFLNGLRLEEALADPLFQTPNEHVKTFRSFFNEPKRGYLRPVKIGSGSPDEEEVLQ